MTEVRKHTSGLHHLACQKHCQYVGFPMLALRDGRVLGYCLDDRWSDVRNFSRALTLQKLVRIPTASVLQSDLLFRQQTFPNHTTKLSGQS
jgi:hypothetical protein